VRSKAGDGPESPDDCVWLMISMIAPFAYGIQNAQRLVFSTSGSQPKDQPDSLIPCSARSAGSWLMSPSLPIFANIPLSSVIPALNPPSPPNAGGYLSPLGPEADGANPPPSNGGPLYPNSPVLLAISFWYSGESMEGSGSWRDASDSCPTLKERPMAVRRKPERASLRGRGMEITMLGSGLVA
jgi:hypothetical protein